MLRRKFKKVLVLMMTLMGIWSYGRAEAYNFQLEIVASVPHPSNPQETLATKVIVGLQDHATDGFDPAWDVAAIQGGIIQSYIDHPEYDSPTRILWQDTRSSTGLPKQWDLRTLPSQSGTLVTLYWSSTALSHLPPNIRIRLVDTDQGDQNTDMRTVFSYSYLHADQTVPHRFQIVADELTSVTPPGNVTPPTTIPPRNVPPDVTPPQISPPPLSILTDHLPPGHLRREYTAQLKAQGGTSPYRWKIVSGRLPTGLKLDPATGVIRGKPRRIGQYRFMVQCMDANGQILQKAFTLTIQLR
jgi:hypothetical protein